MTDIEFAIYVDNLTQAERESLLKKVIFQFHWQEIIPVIDEYVDYCNQRRIICSTGKKVWDDFMNEVESYIG